MTDSLDGSCMGDIPYFTVVGHFALQSISSAFGQDGYAADWARWRDTNPAGLLGSSGFLRRPLMMGDPSSLVLLMSVG